MAPIPDRKFHRDDVLGRFHSILVAPQSVLCLQLKANNCCFDRRHIERTMFIVYVMFNEPQISRTRQHFPGSCCETHSQLRPVKRSGHSIWAHVNDAIRPSYLVHRQPAEHVSTVSDSGNIALTSSARPLK